MTKRKQIYKCEVCGNIVEVTHEGVGELVCCGQPMTLLEEKTADEGMEKHVPVIDVQDDVIEVRVGDVPHPMEDVHFIEWIELDIDGVLFKKYLNPGDEPKAVFAKPKEYTDISAREYCNVHGLWKK